MTIMQMKIRQQASKSGNAKIFGWNLCSKLEIFSIMRCNSNIFEFDKSKRNTEKYNLGENIVDFGKQFDLMRNSSKQK